jgi:class 3 adenylate cyclase
MATRTFTWSFDSPPAAVWEGLGDTARFNEAAGLPKHAIQDVEQDDGSVRFFATAKVGGFELAWEEIPVEWVRDHWFRHERRFSKGPFRTLIAQAELEQTEEGCVCRYSLTAEPSGLVGRALLAGGFFKKTERNFTKLMDDIRAFASRRRERPFRIPPAKPDARRTARRTRAIEKLSESGNDHGLSGRLSDFVVEAQEIDLMAIRPKRLAKQWNVEPRNTTELCLEAVRAGLLESRWDVLCPRCRGPKGSADRLDQLPERVHCGSCNVSYERDFSRNVELSFQPSPAIRLVQSGEFCLFGPMSLPHVLLQVFVAPGETKDVPCTAPSGPFRYRTLELGGEQDLDIGDAALPSLIIQDGEVSIGPASPPGMIRLINRGTHPRTAVVESRAWIAEVLTAHEVTTLQSFHDLFSEDVLRPGDEVSISQVALMFTDLAGSTNLYDRVGDAGAYHLVREHFAFLAAIVREHGGTIVKTIGDAVMAAFADPADAMRAGLEVQKQVDAFRRQSGLDEVAIKVGLHSGACIAVTLNDRLDYFGTMVNLAARLQGLARSGEVVVSGVMAEDPGVASVLTEMLGARSLPQPEDAMVRGLSKPVVLIRLDPNASSMETPK